MKSRKQKNHKRKTFKKFRKSGKKNKTRVKRHMMIRKGGEGSVKNYYDTDVNSSFVDPNQKEEDRNKKNKFNFSGSLNNLGKNITSTLDYTKRRITNSSTVESLIKAIETDKPKEIITKLIDDATNLNAPRYSLKYKMRMTPLIAAIFANNYDIVELLINKGANVNDDIQYDLTRSITPLLAAVNTSNNEKEKGEENYRVSCDIVQLLIDRGAKVSQFNKDGANPIEIAIHGSNIEIIDLLFNAGVKINDKNGDGNTPLHLAVYGDNLGIVNFLIGKGADINQKNNSNMTPLMLAKLLVEDLPYRIKDKSINTRAIFEVLERKEAEKEEKSE
jgi:ankyrin repeat protein